MIEYDFKSCGIGMPRDGSVMLADHESGWAVCYQSVASQIADGLRPDKIELHHMGSTSIFGLKAKPILDILGVFDNIAAFDALQSKIEELGFVWKGEYGIAGRRYCVLYNEDQSQGIVHLHVYGRDNPEVRRHLIFRDYMRAHPEAARAYCALKEELALRFSDAREQYTDSKSAFIMDIVQKAEQESRGM